MEIVLPQALIAPLRLGTHAALVNYLFLEPLLFAAHYAAITTVMDWPTPIEKIRQRVQARYKKHDEVLDLMERLRRQVPVPLSAGLAKSLAEGLEVRGAITHDEYRRLCQEQLAAIAQYQDYGDSAGADTAVGRVDQLASLLDFSPTETQLLSYALVHTILPELQLLTRLFTERKMVRQLFWQTLLDQSSDDLAKALSPQGRLAGSGLLTTRDSIPQVSEFWVKTLIKTDIPFERAITEALAYKESQGGASRLPAEDREILRKLLSEQKAGINVLLYGKAAVDKINLAHRLIRESGGAPYGLVADIPDADRPAAVMVAQRLLTNKPGSPVLVVLNIQSVLTRVLPEGFLLFGLMDDEGEATPRDERILAENPIPTVWIANDPGRLHADTAARFLFHAEVLKGTRADRMAMIESIIASLPVPAKQKEELTKLEGLSAQQLVSARALAEMISGRSRRAFAQHFLLAATRSQKALARRSKDEARLPVTQYSLDYINSAGRFGPEQILKALKRKPLGTLCLYGLPGTGKTQFAEYVALELGKPILIKRASDIFDKYLGESEKRIGEMFDQAEEEATILLLDEADSFLRDRSRSNHGWEVTTVNELLQRMERFDGIFICTTNLYSQIDIAALRRFTFKLEFLPLTIHQRWDMFQNETGLRGKSISERRQSDYEERLAFMKNLAPGDFATVKRQCVLLGEVLSPDEWIEQLELEVRAKNRSEQDASDLQRVA